ncbi:hypothetical protein B0H13DRAFT_1880555 [Mycena leptocephala]|nr:hypothetical protein B0H13DRAFT_1880555 [Mycena leptocephala]
MYYSFTDILSLLMVAFFVSPNRIHTASLLTSVGYKLPPRPRPPPGFAFLATVPEGTPWKFIKQGTGGVYPVASAVGTDGCNPCVALYIRLNADECYVAHIQSNVRTTLEPAVVAAAARSHWQAIVQGFPARGITIDPNQISYFVAAGAQSRGVGEGVADGIQQALNNHEPMHNYEPMQPYETLSPYMGFIYPAQTPASIPLLIGGNSPQFYGWVATEEYGPDSWDLHSVDGGGARPQGWVLVQEARFV